jgi:hypothetical protein
MDNFKLTSSLSESNGEPQPKLGHVVAPPDPFDPSKLRLSQDFSALVGVKKELVTVPVRKPDKSWFVQVHPDADYSMQTAVLNLSEDREMYLVAQPLWPELLTTEKTFMLQALHTAITRQGNIFLWPVGLPGPDGKSNSWNLSALVAVEKARKNWVRVTSNSQTLGYDVVRATGDIPAPTWPDVPFNEILRIAFKNWYVDSLDHQVLRRLRGEV